MKNTTTAKAAPALTASIGKNRHGSLEPQIHVVLPEGSGYRAVSAALHRIAAAAELATPANEEWIAHIEMFCTGCSGRVYFEMAGASTGEAARGFKVLAGVASAWI